MKKGIILPDKALINIELTKPATVLIEKISSAIGIVYEPRKIRQNALAEADASKTKALMDLEIQSIEKRALNRLVTEEIKKQENIESITEKSFSSLNENSTPDKIEDDWISNFFDKCKLISDDDMQTLWSNILAGESNNPGTISKRTVEFLSTLDKYDADLFNNLCKFCWNFGKANPLIINYQDNKIFNKLNIDFNTLSHLDAIGLINFNHSSGYLVKLNNNTMEPIHLSYYGRILTIDFKNKNPKEMQTGCANLTKTGQDLAQISNPHILSADKHEEYMDDYYHYIVEKLHNDNIILSEPLENKRYNKMEQQKSVSSAEI